ncbi:MAG: TIM44-like domain-containing protein [Kofleriaceae bacterium]|nr:TIM44-like domain-containing protein [Kofleriaceae bacterium]
MSRRRWLLALALLVGLTAIAAARPGGGESYSGGGGHGGGGGGGADGAVILELLYWLLRLCIEVPYVGLPLVGGGILWIAYSAYKQHANKDWDSGPTATLRSTTDLTELRTTLDSTFSQPAFEDFAFRLFSTAQRARGTADALATVAPYVADTARQQLAQREPRSTAVEQVAVGAMRVVSLDLPASKTDQAGQPNYVTISVQFEANVATRSATYYSVETWQFVRDAGRRSKPPDATRGFPCPNCGAPWQSTETGTQRCAHCGEVVDNGRFDWVVRHITVESIDQRPPTLTTEVPERGTNLPTYRQGNVENRFRQKVETGPDDRRTFEERLALIYTEVNKAWSAGQLEPIRGFVSDGLYDYFQYWIDAYTKQGLRNELVDMRMTKTELAKVVRDNYFVAVTIRIWATGKDYVVRTSDGHVVRGSKRRERPYSEYWTLIRSVKRTGPAQTENRCNNCGAPLQITMAGACSHCGAHVTAGEFDWVLSKVEQDDSYRG